MSNKNISVWSPMPTGNGAYVVHSQLDRSISGYQIQPYNPKLTYFPPLLSHLKKPKHANLIHCTPDHALFFYDNKTPMVITFHNYVLDKFMLSYSSLIQKIHYQTDLKIFTKNILNKPNITITAVSDYIAEKVMEELKPRSDITVIKNGIDTSLFKPGQHSNSGDRLKILVSGNISKRKGSHWIPEIARMTKEFADYFMTAGLNNTNLTKIKKNQDNIYFIEKTPPNDMPKLYNKMDALLFPTVREGFGLAAAEALACGLPVIATNCSALPEIITNKKLGRLCTLGNTVEFANAIKSLHLEKSTLNKHAKDRFNHIKNKFNYEKMIDNYNKVFMQAIKSQS